MPLAQIANRSLWHKDSDFAATTFTLFNTEETGMGDVTINSIPNVTPVFGRDPNGNFVSILAITEAPGDFDSFDLSFLEDTEFENRALQAIRDKRPLFIQRLTYECPPLNSRTLWKSLEHFRVRPTGGTLAGSPNRDGSDGAVESTVGLVIEGGVRLYKTSLSNLVTAETGGILAVDGFGQFNDCLAGWPGADKILVFAAAADGAAANGLYSMNGGSTIASFTTDPTPFSQTANLTDVAIFVVSDTQFRVVFGRAAGGAGVEAQIAYQDFEFSLSTLTAASWNLVAIDTGNQQNQAVDRLFYYSNESRFYIAAGGGDLYVSTDNGASDPGSPIFTGSNILSDFAVDEDGNVWAVGASNTILRELKSNRNTFAARTGPSGGGAFHSITFDSQGVLYAGNGQKLYKSIDKANVAGGWRELYDAGASHVVRRVQARGNEGQVLRIIVDDTTPGTGTVLESEDGGNNWRTITELTNAGYNDAFFSEDPNKAYVVGDASGGVGKIHLLGI